MSLFVSSSEAGIEKLCYPHTVFSSKGSLYRSKLSSSLGTKKFAFG